MRGSLPERSYTRAGLLACFHLGGHQPDFLDAGLAHDINGARHVLEFDVIVALDESNALGARLKNLVEARAQRGPVALFLIDFQGSTRANLLT